MTPGPGTSWPAELDYFDDEQVDLDLAAIIARGARIRRKRFLTRVAVVALICGVGPAAFTLSQLEPISGHSGTRKDADSPPASFAPPGTSSTAATSQGAGNATPGPGYSTINGPFRDPDDGTGPRGSEKPPPEFNVRVQSPGFTGTPGKYSLQPVQLVAKLTVSLPASYGPLRALAGAPAGGGVWYVGTASRVVLFHLNLRGVVRSWPVLTVSGAGRFAAAHAPVGLAVTASGIAWLGVDTTLVRVNTRTGLVSSWSIPAPRIARPSNYDPRTRRHQDVRAVAVSPAGGVAVALSHSSAVQVLSPRTNDFHQVPMPAVTDETEAVGYTRDGTLGVGYVDLTGARGSGVLMSAATGPILTASVTDARSVLPYRASWLLVGVGRPDVVTATAQVQPLRLPDSPLGITKSVMPLVSLPDDRVATATGPVILSFPAYATSTEEATHESDLYDTTPQWCPPPDPALTAYVPAEPPGGAVAKPLDRCPQGFQLVATDKIGDIWVVPAARKGTLELLTLR